MLQWIRQQEHSTQKSVIIRTVILVTVFLFFTLLLPLAAEAGTAAPVAQPNAFGLDQVDSTVNLGTDDIRLTIARIIRAVLGLLGIITLVLMLYAGYTIMTAGGNEEKVLKGRKILVNATIGLGIILSSFAITQFVISRLAAATGINGPVGSAAIAPPPRQTFAGSGALGRIVKDHYPFRDQRDVARNTNITVTFREPIDPSSLITDTNNNNTFGDCINTGTPNFDWNTDCDRLITSAVTITASSTNPQPIDMVALATAEGANNEYFTFTFRSLTGSPLGSATQDVLYTVVLTGNVLKADGQTSAFVSSRGGRYQWQFYTGTTLDLDPPQITAVYPTNQGAIPRNSIIQIFFDEPVDPTVVQGFAQNASFFNIIFGDQSVTGEWKVSNGYRAVEFVPDVACGANSCGDPMYCLPVTCPAANPTCTSQPYQVLVRTASIQSGGNPFEAVPFSGVVDMANNALDGNANDQADGKPPMPSDTFKRIGSAANPPNENQPDNYLWSFTVQNQIDRTAPNVERMTPGVDQQDVAPNADHTITFSRPMWMGTLADIGLQEYGLPAPASGEQPVDPIWYRPIGSLQGGRTVVSSSHRVFGPNDTDAYYFTSIPSTVKSVTQNCVYPGRGPSDTSPTCTCTVDPVTNATQCTGCVNVTTDRTTDTGCVQTSNSAAILQPDVTSCITQLEQLSPVN